MIIKSSVLQGIRTALRSDFQGGFEGVTPNYSKLAMVVPSSTASNTYGWLGSMPSVREWIGDRVVNDLKEHAYTITNKEYELTVGVKRTDIEDDNLGVYTPLMAEMGRAMAAHPGEMVFDLLSKGFTTTCYDGQYFFDTDHPVNASHDGTGAVTTVSNIQPGAGTEDPWYLIDASRAILPLIFQDRKKPIFTSMTALDDETVFTANVFRFGADMRGNVGFGLWQQAYASRQTLTEDNFNAARVAMMSQKKDGGKPLGIKPTVIVVGASQLVAAERLFLTEKLASGATNPLYKKVEVVFSEYLP